MRFLPALLPSLTFRTAHAQRTEVNTTANVNVQ